MVKYVELLTDVAEGGRDLAKAQAAADSFGLGKNAPNYPRLKVTTGRRGEIRYEKGLVISMTAPGAEKWISAGIAKEVPKPQELTRAE